jgi:hypothetical protein
MQFPISTGQAAHLLRTTEPRLSETVRRGLVTPKPTIFVGRRLWTREQFMQAAQVLQVPEDELRRRLDEAAS